MPRGGKNSPKRGQSEVGGLSSPKSRMELTGSPRLMQAAAGIRLLQYTSSRKRALYLAILYAHQQGRCAICKEERLPEQMFIDHNHGSGQIRGLLCPSCNTGIGFFKDDSERLIAAAGYLRKLTPRQPEDTVEGVHARPNGDGTAQGKPLDLGRID